MDDKYLELWKEANSRLESELSHLWQRSILLTAMIVVICTVYASLMPKMLDPNSNVDPIVINEVAGFVALIGLVFAIVWIMMGKGSKSWFEVQEKRISTIENKLFGPDYDGYKMGDDCSLKHIDSCIFSTKAGKYSVSRLNVFIGIAMSIFWIALFIVHFVKVCLILTKDCSCSHCWIAILMVLLFLTIMTTAICNSWARSTTLEKEE